MVANLLNHSANTTAGAAIAVDELGYLTLGIVFFTIGLITLLLTILRSASRERSVFFFGAMSCIWGLRFLLYTQVIPRLLTDDLLSLARAARSITYFSGAAAFGFAFAFLGRGWRSTLRALAWTSLLFSVAASVVLLIAADRDLLLPAFNVLVLAGAVLVIANALHPRIRSQNSHGGLVPGIIASVVFFILENLRALGIVRVSFDLEWIGVLVLYVTLGRLIALRLFANERRLAALNQELETARRIQGSLMPGKAPPIAGISVVARYAPMSKVAGDMYDFVQVDDHRLAILIADVSGHGVPAALIASMVKGAFRAQMEVMDRPDAVLAGMNRILCGELGANFVTAHCALIDMQNRRLRCASAGHPPLLVRPADGSPYREAGGRGLILGQFPSAEYESVELPLAPDERLLFYTDGIPEATDANDAQYGDGAMQAFLAAHQGLSADDLADALISSVRDWAGTGDEGSLDDDLTLIVVDVLPSAGGGTDPSSPNRKPAA